MRDPGAAYDLRNDLGGKSKGEKRGHGSGAHSGKIAEAAGEAAVSNGFGGVEIAAEVAAFERKVRGDKNFAARWRPEDRAIVADA